MGALARARGGVRKLVVAEAFDFATTSVPAPVVRVGRGGEREAPRQPDQTADPGRPVRRIERLGACWAAAEQDGEQGAADREPGADQRDRDEGGGDGGEGSWYAACAQQGQPAGEGLAPFLGEAERQRGAGADGESEDELAY